MNFLFQTPHPWRGIRQRCHHLAQRFALWGHRVHWVEPRYLRWLAQGRAGDFFQAQAERPAAGLSVEPVTLVNGERLAPVRAWNRARLAGALRGAKGLQTGQPTVLWLYNPHEEHLARSVPHDLLVYDIMDEYRGFPWSPRGIEQEEGRLLAGADWVFAGTHALYEAKAPQAAGKIECVLSGVETEHFSSPGVEGPNRQIRSLKARFRKVIGYAGMIDLRVDQDLLATAAARFPHWCFVMIGPRAAAMEKLQGLENVVFMGAVPYGRLPSFYHAWDAAMLPFVENELTRHINPTKMLEYGAAQLPIVARALPDVARFYVQGAWLYRTADEFMACLEELENPQAERYHARLEAAWDWAQERSWDQLAKQMLARVESLTAGTAHAGT